MKKSLSYLFFPNAFTLVELIVVIAVLSVLAAISFSTVANITSGARDSARLTDISSMKTSLETYNATKGGFPLPDNATAITWSGNLAWSQGTFGDNTARALNTISRPKDPKWGVDYSYSVSNSKKEYEIATVLEKATSFNGISKAYAQGEQYDTVIKGNYNWVALKISSAISTWILSVPTLIVSDIKDAKLENVVFSYPKSGNEPFSYTGVVNSPQAVPTGWTAKQVWSGAVNTPTALPKTDSELQQLTTDLKTAYTGSPAGSSETIKSLLATTDNKAYASNVVNNVGGNVVINSPSNVVNTGGAVSLLHFDGNTTDTKGTVWTTSSSVISSTQSKFGGSSLYFPGGSKFSALSPMQTLFDAPFTFDLWVYPTSYASGGGDQGTPLVAFTGYWDGYSNALIYINKNAWGTITVSPHPLANINSSSVAPLNTWTHIEVTYDMTTLRLFMNGNLEGSSAWGTVATGLGNIVMGLTAGTYTYQYYGYIDEFRISNIARHTANFTPPTAPY